MRIEVLDATLDSDRDSQSYRYAYAMWHETWTEAYAQLGLGSTLHSDTFTRQTNVLCFFIENKCAALTCFQTVDLSTAWGRGDSWLSGWPPDILDRLEGKGPKVLICSAFAIAQPFRRQTVGTVKLKDLLSTASGYFFEQYTPHFGMLGSMRNTKGMNSSVFRCGATLLGTVEMKLEPTDLVVFERGKLHPLTPEVDFLFKRHWVQKPAQKVAKAA